MLRKKTKATTREFRTLGPPGCGKTTWMVDQVAESVEKFGSDMVSVCSLTKAAVKEASGRDLPIPEEQITTFHARCKRALGAPAPAESRVKEFIESHSVQEGDLPKWLMARAESDPDDDEESIGETLLSGGGLSLYDQANVLRQQMIPMDQWPYGIREWYLLWEAWCKDIGHLDYTGWIEEVLRTKSLPPQQTVYVDEGQDHTLLQLTALRSWDTRNLVIIGDDDQNLYEWSGADPAAFYSHPVEAEFLLEQSYRVPRAVHWVATKLLKLLEARREKVYRPRDADGAVYRSSYSLADVIPGYLPEGLLDDPDPEATYMILTTCGYMLRGLLRELRGSGIGFHNPYRKSNPQWNPLAKTQPKIQAYLSKEWTGEEVYTWASLLDGKVVLREDVDRQAFLNYCKGLGSQPVPVQALGKAFHDQLLRRMMRRDLGILQDFRRAGLAGSWDYALKVGGRAPRVVVGTINSVKGGQADHVHLFPDLSQAGSREMDNPFTSDRMVRLFYVGMTRARKTLTLGQPSNPRLYMPWRT